MVVLDRKRSRGNQQQIISKEEQQVAIEKLLLGQDVLAVLPTGYGKSMISIISRR